MFLPAYSTALSCASGSLQYAGQLVEGLSPRINSCWQWVQGTRFWIVTCRPTYERYIVPLNQSDKKKALSTAAVAIACLILTRMVKPTYLPISGIISVAILYNLTWKTIRLRIEEPLNIAIANRIPELLDAVRATTRQAELPQALDTFETLLKSSENSHLEDEPKYFENLKKAFVAAHGREEVIELKLALSNYLNPIIANAAGHPIQPYLLAFEVAVVNLGTLLQNIAEYRRTFNELEQRQQTLQLTPESQLQRAEIERRKGAIDRVINQPSFIACREQLADFLVRLHNQLNPTAALLV